MQVVNMFNLYSISAVTCGVMTMVGVLIVLGDEACEINYLAHE